MPLVASSYHGRVKLHVCTYCTLRVGKVFRFSSGLSCHLSPDCQPALAAQFRSKINKNASYFSYTSLRIHLWLHLCIQTHNSLTANMITVIMFAVGVIISDYLVINMIITNNHLTPRSTLPGRGVCILFANLL